MSGTSNSTGNKVNVPEAKAAMEQFKYEVANEIGVPLKKGYAEPVDERQMKLKIVLNTGDTRNRVYEKQACGGEKDGVRSGHTMKDICPERNREYLRNLRSCQGHAYAVTYHYSVGI